MNLEVGKGIPDVDSPKAVTPKKLQTLEGEVPSLQKCNLLCRACSNCLGQGKHSEEPGCHTKDHRPGRRGQLQHPDQPVSLTQVLCRAVLQVKCLRPIDLSWEENARESAFRTLPRS